MLHAKGLVYRFEGRRGEAAAVVDIAELNASAGKLTVVTGPSGSGKTTLLYLLAGLLRAQAGRIEWAGTDIGPLPERRRDHWRRRNAGFVFQNFHLFDDLTPLQNVVLPAYFDRLAAGRLRHEGRALLKRLGVPEEARPAGTYSRGEQQRIALARALLFDPPILFADEPTASLDAENAGALAQSFRDLAATGKCIVAVSHDLALIGAADALVRLEHGRIAA